MGQAKYWVIKSLVDDQDHYWIGGGGVSLYQNKAERFATKEQALADVAKFASPDEPGRVVKIVAKRKKRH